MNEQKAVKEVRTYNPEWLKCIRNCCDEFPGSNSSTEIINILRLETLVVCHFNKKLIFVDNGGVCIEATLNYTKVGYQFHKDDGLNECVCWAIDIIKDFYEYHPTFMIDC